MKELLQAKGEALTLTLALALALTLTLKELLRANGDVQVVNVQGLTALHFAGYNSHIGVVQVCPEPC